MKSVHGLAALKFLAIIISLFIFYPQPANAAESHPIQIREWQVKWIEDDDPADTVPSIDGKWEEISADKPKTVVPDGARGMWVHLIVPPTSDWQRPGMLADRLYGLELSVYQGNQLVFESKRDFGFDLNKLLLPIGQFSEPQDFYIRIATTSERAGLISAIRIDDFETLSHRFFSKELPDLLLGTSIAFLALIMFICSGFVHRRQRSWISLCLIALTTGILIIVYCPLTYIYLKEYGNVLLLLFDVSLFVLFPSLSYYIDQVFEGQYRTFTKFRHFQTAYSAACLVGLFIYATSIDRYYDLFYLLSNVIMGALILTQLLFIVLLSILNAKKGSKDSFILSGGILSLALSGTVDLTLYYLSDKRYVLFLWKFGVVIMIVTLVIILARRISADYSKLVTYSKELELYNHSLQRTEKMKIISDLAASVAHEVRNPLQVTRGFMQLLAGKTDEKSKSYFDLAINELDRAADIITDFLTFAKPEIDKISLLDLSREIRKIEAMMIPLAAMHGGILVCHTQENLYFHGNSSKLKQALINIIKNSIEAIGKEGLIEIKAASEEGDAVIRITDNGEGMDEEQIVKLGVPFFSTKTKGTGLGLMVTFRIIEVMKGTIKIHSTKGKGTEFLIRFPLVVKDKILPNDVGA